MGWGWGGTAGASPSDQQDGPGAGQGGAELRPKHRGQGSGQAAGALPGACCGYGLSAGIPFSFGPSRGACSILPQVPPPQAVPGKLWPGLGGARAAPGTLLLPLPCPIASGETLRRAPRRNPPLPAVSRHSAWGTADVTATGRAKASQSQIAGTESKQNKKKRKERKKRCSKGARGNADAPGERQPQ